MLFQGSARYINFLIGFNAFVSLSYYLSSPQQLREVIDSVVDDDPCVVLGVVIRHLLDGVDLEPLPNLLVIVLSVHLLQQGLLRAGLGAGGHGRRFRIVRSGGYPRLQTLQGVEEIFIVLRGGSGGAERVLLAEEEGVGGRGQGAIGEREDLEKEKHGKV